MKNCVSRIHHAVLVMKSVDLGTYTHSEEVVHTVMANSNQFLGHTVVRSISTVWKF